MLIEHVILKSLIFNEDYTRKVLPFLKDEYFGDRTQKLVFNEIESYISKYNTNPTYESLVIEINNKSINDDEFNRSMELLDELNQNRHETSKEEWLIDETEKFCQDKAILNGVRNAIEILDGKNTTHDKGAIPDILTKALSISFDNHVGHDFIDDSESRYEYYHRKEEKIPFDLEYLNKITKGGLPKKSLNIILAGPGVGKSLFLCHHAAFCLMQNKNVLYITMEMAEERIAERIDANLLNVTIDDLHNITKEEYVKRIGKLKNSKTGKLIIKEYPTASAGSNHFRSLMNELNLKKNFIPDILFIDYMNICSSSRLKMGSSVNSYTFVKSIAEEIRGLSVEFNIPIMTASQLTRTGASSSDPGMDDVSESFGVAATADIMFALISTEELEELNQIMVKQIKNRYYDPTKNKRFIIGVDRSKMKLYDAERSSQCGIVDSGQTPENKFQPPQNKKSFEQFKF